MDPQGVVACSYSRGIVFLARPSSAIGLTYMIGREVSRLNTIRRAVLRTTSALPLRGATWFRDIITGINEVYASFREAYQCRGLLAVDDESKRTLRDSFRSSFVPLSEVLPTTFSCCNSSSQNDLCRGNKSLFTTDIGNRLKQHISVLHSDDDAASQVLKEILNQFKIMTGMSLRYLGLKPPKACLPPSPEQTSYSYLQKMNEYTQYLLHSVRSILRCSLNFCCRPPCCFNRSS